jgi:hypothetical protein
MLPMRAPSRCGCRFRVRVAGRVVQHSVKADNGEQEGDGGDEQRQQGEEAFADALVVGEFLLRLAWAGMRFATLARVIKSTRATRTPSLPHE